MDLCLGIVDVPTTMMNEFQTNASFTLSSPNPRYYYSSPPLVAMQNQREYRSLWFIVYGDPSPVSQVNVHIDLKIDGLKKAINEERVRLNCPPLRKMLLWKPNTPISVSDFETDALDTNFVRFPDPSSGDGFDTNGAIQHLRVTDTIFRHWRKCPDETQLHIIAQEQSDEVRFLDTFLRLRTHLWGSNRFNIVSTAENSYNTIDLTLFDLPQLNPHSRKILLFRDEYRLAYNTIREAAIRCRCVYLVTGQPGIGKTFFLLCLLVHLLQERVPVALQIDAKKFVLFDNHGARIYKTDSTYASAIPKGAWALSDSSAKDQLEPCAAFKYSKAHIVHTSSPASHRWKDWVKEIGATRYIMDVWSSEELRVLLTISGADSQRGVDLFRIYGSNVRAIVDIIDTPAKEASYLTDVRAGASGFAIKFSTVLSDLQNLDFASKASSKIFTVRPDNSVSREPVLRIPTSFLAATLGLALARQAVAQQHAAFTMLSKHPSLRTAAGWLFENYAHVVLSDPNRAPLPTYIRNETGAPSIPPPNEIKSGSTALNNIQPPFSFYWRPREPNFEGLDAVICDDDTAWGLQYTIRAKHGSVTEGLTQVRKVMNHKKGVEFRVAMLGSEQASAESARDNQKLTGIWADKPISACELPMGNVNELLLQHALDEARDSYPEDQSLDVSIRI